MNVLDQIELRSCDCETKPKTIANCRAAANSLRKFLGRDPQPEDLAPEVLNEWEASLGVTPSTVRSYREALNGLRHWISDTPPADGSASFENLLRFTLDKSGKVTRRRRGSGHTARIADEVRDTCEAFLRRPFEVADINPDICELLVCKWKRKKMRGRVIHNRYQWFVDRNEIAVQLGWSEKHDFSHIQPARYRDWSETRQNIDLPEPIESIDDADDAGHMTLSTLLDDHYIPARLVGKSKNTIRLYRVCIRNFSKWLGRDAVVADLTTQTIGKYLQHSIENTSLSPHTIEKEAAEFRAFSTFCARRGWLRSCPDIPSINCPKRVPEAWTDEELVRLMNACENAVGDVGSVPASHWWPALVSLIYDCGERISAVLSIEKTDIGSDGWLTVRGEYRKGKTRDKRYKLRPETLERIHRMKVTSGAVFAWPMHPNYIYTRFDEILKAAGLPATRRDKFHKIRRTTASNFEAAGGNATRLLDHTDRRTTEAYLDPRALKEIHPADIVPGIGQDREGKRSDKEDDRDQLIDEFRLFLEAKRGA
ncbi:tyrosine-type recombinase/integrase [Roseiconus lacunae]|uniref:Phage integrase N-terminal SAM-like domain-containing protein n=1 Tax=Roseiconus lacunae TaxID=2605694 RepID=A0ABT7PDU7_9BACT|nr:tyrosine-type recombinase/integrase [Roseiconus lacunae]MDM4014677.1 phage integrase N-terminal SAM-like domain-containing protein [Roseiconus lacunae]